MNEENKEEVEINVNDDLQQPENLQEVVIKPIDEVQTCDHGPDDKSAVRSDESTRKWNWGAFTFPLFWGIANRVWLCFIVLIPFMHLIWPFFLAYNGNKWAYNKYLENGNKGRGKFNYAQKTWNSAGFWAFIIMIAGFIILIFTWSFIIAVIYSNVVNGGSYYDSWSDGNNFEGFEFFEE